jgi:hypothetical protein
MKDESSKSSRKELESFLALLEGGQSDQTRRLSHTVFEHKVLASDKRGQRDQPDHPHSTLIDEQGLHDESHNETGRNHLEEKKCSL